MTLSKRSRFCWCVTVLVLTVSGRVLAQPLDAGKIHVGAASCAGAGCHGAGSPSPGSHVKQDEFFVWQQQDAHANAYKLLLSEQGKRIATNLGLAAAHQSAECLTCHSDTVPAAQRGQRYRLEDGVSCEVCHGAAQDWIASHPRGRTHAENLAAGMRPLSDPVERARVCLHCHLGSDEKPINHRLMSAGHPPLVFELDTFTAIQPAHFEADADYRLRKPGSTGTRAWMLGQLAAAEFVLNNLLSARFNHSGLFPELVFFDCNACHHPTQPPRWSGGVAGSLGPGSARLSSSALEIVGLILSGLKSVRADEWNTAVTDLHAASQKSIVQTQDATRRLQALLPDLYDEFRQVELKKRERLGLINRLAETGSGAAAASFSAAEQTAMALGVLCNELALVDRVSAATLKPALDAVYAASGKRDAYVPDKFRAAVRKLRERAAKSG